MNPRMHCLPAPLVRVVDDDESVRNSEAFVLSMAGLDVRTSTSAEDFLGTEDFVRPGCIVLDILMPGMSGLELQAELNRRGSTLPILFLTGHGDVDMAVLALKRGAADFLQKPVIPEKLQQAVRRLVHWHERTLRSMADQHESRRRLCTLTPREAEVVRLAAKGLLSREIAGLLGTSEATVKQQRACAMRKLETDNLAELIELLQTADAPSCPRVPLEEPPEE